MLIPLKRSSPVLVMINSMPVPVCNRFHARRANNGKIRTFLGVSPCLRGTLLPKGSEVRHKKTGVRVAAQ